MSYLGASGHIMSGSGLHELLETVYASNAVSHILSGKAIARAVRGHFLVSAALHVLLISKVFGTELPKKFEDAEAPNNELIKIADELDTNPVEVEQTLPDIIKEAKKLYDDLVSEKYHTGRYREFTYTGTDW